jgi:hypothetical protein
VTGFDLFVVAGPRAGETFHFLDRLPPRIRVADADYRAPQLWDDPTEHTVPATTYVVEWLDLVGYVAWPDTVFGGYPGVRPFR